MDKLKLKEYGKSDRALVFVVAGLVLFGVVAVYSASAYSAKVYYGNEYYFLVKQLVGAALGLTATFACSRIDYHALEKAKLPLLILSYVALLLVFVPGVGVESYGARRWIKLPFITVQASELAKFGLVVFIASYAAKKHEKMTSFRTLLPVLAVAGSVCALVIAEPNMSVTMSAAIVTFIMLFASGAKIKHLALLCVPAVLLAGVLIIIAPYRLQRLTAFLDPWASPLGEGYQLIQSFYALGSGGAWGVGLFNSRQKYLFLPFAESDFIFSVIGEELGFCGAAIVVAAYVFITWRIFRIAKRANDRFGCYLCVGVAALIAVQTAINIAVVTGSIPPTGVPLPFVSAGSSSLVVFCAAVGFTLSVERRSHKSVECFAVKKHGGYRDRYRGVGQKKEAVVRETVDKRGKAGEVALPNHKVDTARPKQDSG